MLKDRVHRALAGEVISPETLNWFIDAFQMTSEDARRLCGVRANGRFGTEDVNVAAPRTAEAVVNSLRDPQYLPFPQRHQTVSVFERRVIGPDGRPIAHHTIRAIKAGEDGVRSHHCWLMPGVSSVSVRYGGRAAVVREFDGSDAIVDIELTRPLFAGQTTSLQYDFEFGPNCGRSTDYRRVAYARTDNVDLVVQFDPSHPPHRLWWAIWDDHRGGTLLHEEPAVLDGEGSVHWFLRYLENAAVGFRWDW